MVECGGYGVECGRARVLDNSRCTDTGSRTDLLDFRGVILRTVPPQNGKYREIPFPSLPVVFTSHLFIVVILGVG